MAWRSAQLSILALVVSIQACFGEAEAETAVAHTCGEERLGGSQSCVQRSVGQSMLQVASSRSRGNQAQEVGAQSVAGASAVDATQASASNGDLDKKDPSYRLIAPFGKENTAFELQDHASRTQDTLVDAVENAEVAEIKRVVFRALTRLRAAQIKEFDTIARLETQAIDSYNDAHHYRKENPLEHMGSEEPAVPSDKLESFH